MVASSESILIWSLQEGAVLQQANAPGTSGSTIAPEAIMSGARPAYIFGVSRQPGGSLVATACCDGVVRLWSLRPTGHLEWAGQMAFPGQPMLTGCAFADDGSLLGVCSREGRLIELDVRTLEVLSSRVLPASPLTIAYLPAASGAATAAETSVAVAKDGIGACVRQLQPQQQQGSLWLVACRDGAVYGYAPGQQGGGPFCELRPPGDAGAAVLALAVAPGGSAVALGGEPQDVALLPPIHPQSSRTQARTTTDTTSTSTAGSTSSRVGDPSSGAATSLGHPLQQLPAAPAAPAAPSTAARAAVAVPARRRGAGAGRAVVAGSILARQGPMSIFDEGADGRDIRGPAGHGGGGGGGGRKIGAVAEATHVTERRSRMGGGAGGDGAADTMLNNLAAMSLKEAGALASQSQPSSAITPPPAAAGFGVHTANGRTSPGRDEQQQQEEGHFADGRGNGEDVAMEEEEASAPRPPAYNHQQQQQQQQQLIAGQQDGVDMEVADGGGYPETGAANHRALGPAAASAPAVLSGRSRAPLFVYRGQY
ncbi:hypothetical protein Vretifemale_9690 [Volvox reticuliferus]|nr:hypothetical protein Vretifemale_9690 [Volvox reticuliferus]